MLLILTAETEVLLEKLISYSIVIFVILLSVYVYVKMKKKGYKKVEKNIKKAKEMGLYEPISLHPVVNTELCIGSGACIKACPEKDILGIVGGQAKHVNTSRCIGHGACFHACPMSAISLVMGTETRGVELPHINSNFETNIPGMYIVGELGGMGLIKNAVEQGRQAVENITGILKNSINADYDIAIIGAGPAGISGTLTAVKNKLKYITLEQDTIGGTVYSFPREKIVMTSPMYLPLFGKVKLTTTSKSELLNLWNSVIEKNNIKINEQERVISVDKHNDVFIVETSIQKITARKVLLAIGRRGSPKKLSVIGEEKEKVFYRLLDPEIIKNKKILVVGGGDSAIESALLLNESHNKVTLSYRNNVFNRIKEANFEKINKAIDEQKIEVLYNSKVIEIKDKSVVLNFSDNSSQIEIENDLVYVFVGGELPNAFLDKIGIKITKRFGEVILKH